jgi:hypothetical protein
MPPSELDANLACSFPAETVQEERNPSRSAPENIPKGPESSPRAVENPTLLLGENLVPQNDKRVRCSSMSPDQSKLAKFIPSTAVTKRFVRQAMLAEPSGYVLKRLAPSVAAPFLPAVSATGSVTSGWIDEARLSFPGERMNHGLVKNWEFKDEKTVCEGLPGGATVHLGRLKLERCESRATSQIPTGRVTSSMSFEVAVQLSDTESSVALMTLRNTGSPPAHVSLLLDASHWAVELSGVPRRFDESAPEEDTCQPIHLVMVVGVQSKTCTVKCYRNGVRLGGHVQHEAPAFGPNINKQLVLGNYSDYKKKVFAPSQIFFARLYNQELESDEVEALYCAFEEEFRDGVV